MTACLERREISVRDEVYEVPCGSRYCAACGQRWQGDQRAQAVAASEVLPGGAALITVTAPGMAYFGSLDAWGMTPMRVRYDRWNKRARARWRQLHLYASRPMRAWAKKNGVEWRVWFRAWEFQKRGALHLHLVLPYGTDEERRFTDLYVWNLWNAAAEYGFGYVLGGDRRHQPARGECPVVVPADGPAAARYVCKYVASVGAGKGSMVEVAQRTAQRGSVLYVSSTLTRASGVNMTKLRARRRIMNAYPWAVYSHGSWKAACLVDAIQRGRPPLTTHAVHCLWRAARRTGARLWVDCATGELCTPTDAPPPPQMPLSCDLVEREGYVLDPELAPVLVRDPERPHLGGIRTEVID